MEMTIFESCVGIQAKITDKFLLYTQLDVYLFENLRNCYFITK